MENKQLTWYDLQEQTRVSIRETIAWYLKELREEDRTELELDEIAEEMRDEGNIDQVIDNCIPIYTADTLTVVASNLSLNHSEADIGYAENATPIDIFNVNIYEELSEYVYGNLEDWIDEEINDHLNSLISKKA